MRFVCIHVKSCGRCAEEARKALKVEVCMYACEQAWKRCRRGAEEMRKRHVRAWKRGRRGPEEAWKRCRRGKIEVLMRHVRGVEEAKKCCAESGGEIGAEETNKRCGRGT